jgi:hypothetical protein
MPSPPKGAAASVLPSVFSGALAVEMRVAASSMGFQLYVDVVLRSRNGSERVADLRRIPHQLRIRGENCSLPHRAHQALHRLGEWEHYFDTRRGFVFAEKDVPEVLKFLRSQSVATFARSASEITVDDRPMEYSHQVREIGRNVQIATVLEHPKLEITVTKEEQVRFPEGSKYAHVGSAFLGKPKSPGFKTIKTRIGVIELAGDQIALFLLHDLKRLRSGRRNKVSREVESMKVITSPFEPRVAFDVDESWIWFDVTFRAGSFVLPFQRIEQAGSDEQFVRGGETWIRVDRKAHARVMQCLGEIPELERVQEHFQAPACHFSKAEALFSESAIVDLSEACKEYATRYEEGESELRARSPVMPSEGRELERKA